MPRPLAGFFVSGLGSVVLNSTQNITNSRWFEFFANISISVDRAQNDVYKLTRIYFSNFHEIRSDFIISETYISQTKQKFATQIDTDLLIGLKDKAQSEGRKILSVVEDALRSHMEGQDTHAPRRAVMKAYQSSQERFAELYKKLAE